MRRFKKSLITTALSLALILGMSFPVSAAGQIDNWYIYYTPGAPSHLSIQNDILTLNYYSGGYRAYAETFTGTSGTYLEITSSSAGGMESVSVTVAKKYTKIWKMSGSTTGTVTFLVTALDDYRCESTGYICTADY